jgi:hypothetical protein
MRHFHKRHYSENRPTQVTFATNTGLHRGRSNELQAYTGDVSNKYSPTQVMLARTMGLREACRKYGPA